MNRLTHAERLGKKNKKVRERKGQKEVKEKQAVYNKSIFASLRKERRKEWPSL